MVPTAFPKLPTPATTVTPIIKYAPKGVKAECSALDTIYAFRLRYNQSFFATWQPTKTLIGTLTRMRLLMRQAVNV